MRACAAQGAVPEMTTPTNNLIAGRQSRAPRPQDPRLARHRPTAAQGLQAAAGLLRPGRGQRLAAHGDRGPARQIAPWVSYSIAAVHRRMAAHHGFRIHAEKVVAAMIALFFGDRMWHRGHKVFAQGLTGFGLALPGAAA